MANVTRICLGRYVVIIQRDKKYHYFHFSTIYQDKWRARFWARTLDEKPGNFFSSVSTYWQKGLLSFLVYFFFGKCTLYFQIHKRSGQFSLQMKKVSNVILSLVRWEYISRNTASEVLKEQKDFLLGRSTSISHSKCKFHANSAHLFRAFCFLILSFTPITALFQCQNRFLSLHPRHRYVYNLHSACPCRQALHPNNASKEFFCNANFTFGIKLRVKCNKILSRARI